MGDFNKMGVEISGPKSLFGKSKQYRLSDILGSKQDHIIMKFTGR